MPAPRGGCGCTKLAAPFPGASDLTFAGFLPLDTAPPIVSEVGITLSSFVSLNWPGGPGPGRAGVLSIFSPVAATSRLSLWISKKAVRLRHSGCSLNAVDAHATVSRELRTPLFASVAQGGANWKAVYSCFKIYSVSKLASNVIVEGSFGTGSHIHTARSDSVNPIWSVWYCVNLSAALELPFSAAHWASLLIRALRVDPFHDAVHMKLVVAVSSGWRRIEMSQ